MNLLNAVDVSVSSSSSGNGTNAVVASLLGGMGACEAIIEALDRYSMDVILCEKAICALSSLSEDLKGTGAWIGHTGGCRALLSAMQRHPTNAAIVKAGWAAVLNIARDVTCRSRFGSCGACELAHSTLETYFIKGASMNGLVGAEIGVLSLKVLGRLCEEIGGNCRRVIADNVCASLLTCINAAGAAITKGVSTGAITHESCSLVTSLAHYIRATNSRDAANGLINELVVSSGLLSVLLRAVCHDVTAANVCEAGCHMVAMVVAENPLAQGEMTCTIGVTAGIRCGCDLMVHVLRHHAWMEGVCAACSLAIFAICDGTYKLKL